MLQGVVVDDTRPWIPIWLDFEQNLRFIPRRIAPWRAGELCELDGEYFPGKIPIPTFGSPPIYR
jgi:hypothetical protein